MAKNEKPKQTKRTEIKDLPVTEKELTAQETSEIKGGREGASSGGSTMVTPIGTPTKRPQGGTDFLRYADES